MRAADEIGQRCRSPRPPRTGTGWRSARHGRRHADRPARSRTARHRRARRLPIAAPCAAMAAIGRDQHAAPRPGSAASLPEARRSARPGRPASALRAEMRRPPTALGRHMRGPFVEDRAGDDARRARGTAARRARSGPAPRSRERPPTGCESAGLSIGWSRMFQRRSRPGRAPLTTRRRAPARRHSGARAPHRRGSPRPGRCG